MAKEYFKRIIRLRKEMGMRPLQKYENFIRQLERKIHHDSI